jgi:DNA primase
MIPESIVDEIRARADIVEVIGEQIALKRAGQNHVALCPFHQEKTPSFNVVPSKGIYKCFGCGESGDIFTFLMKRGGLSFPEAARELGRRVGVDVPDVDLSRAAEDPHRALYEAVAFADDFFRDNLRAAESGARARKYLADRGIPEPAVERFGLGYVPDGWRLLREEAHRLGMNDELLVAAGLIKESERGEEPYDRFRDRLIFPVADLGGRTIAFGGRVLGRASDGVPKYLNSPETPIYHKGDLLYGLNWSRGAIRREGVALVVEGYMDYVALAGRGVENIVAGMGTAMTAAQANLLARYTGKALLLYDSDPAGLKATFRTADALLQVGVHPLVVTLPEGEDPDSLVRRGGTEALRPLLQAAVDVLDRKLLVLEQRGLFGDIEGVRRSLDRLLPTLRATVDPALRDIYIARVAQRTGVRRETLEQELERFTAVPAVSPGRRTAAQVPAPQREQWAAERLLLMVLLTDAARIEEARQSILPANLHDPRHREIYAALLDGANAQRVSPSAAERAEELRRGAALEIQDADSAVAAAIADMQLQELDLHDSRIEAELADADAERTILLIREKERIQRERGRLSEQAQVGMRSSRRYRKLLRRPDRPTPQRNE